VVLNAFALYAADDILDGVALTGVVPAVVGGLVLGVVNAIIRPVLIILTRAFTFVMRAKTVVRVRRARGEARVGRRDVLACRELTSHGCVRMRRIEVVVAAKTGDNRQDRHLDVGSGFCCSSLVTTTAVAW
jgi:Mycobacterial 4 TMS phage holin, superfamily IV